MTTETISALALPLPQPEDHTPQTATTASELTELALPLPQPKEHVLLTRHKGPIAHIDVYVDDFIGIAQGSWCWCRKVWQCIMHAVDDIFSQPDAMTAKHKEAVSEKKLLKGEGGWSQQKEILGWILDTSKRIWNYLTGRRVAFSLSLKTSITRGELVSRNGSDCSANFNSWDSQCLVPPASSGHSNWDSLQPTSTACASPHTFRTT